MLKFLLIVSKQGHTRISQYYEFIELEDRKNLEAEIIRKCLTRNDNLPIDLWLAHITKGDITCSFMEFNNYKVVYRRYASLYFIVGVDSEENELAILEFIHNFVETLDRYFSNACELDIMFHLDKVHMILDEMIMNGHIVETNKDRILAPIAVLDKLAK